MQCMQAIEAILETSSQAIAYGWNKYQACSRSTKSLLGLSNHERSVQI